MRSLSKRDQKVLDDNQTYIHALLRTGWRLAPLDHLVAALASEKPEERLIAVRVDPFKEKVEVVCGDYWPVDIPYSWFPKAGDIPKIEFENAHVTDQGSTLAVGDRLEVESVAVVHQLRERR